MRAFLTWTILLLFLVSCIFIFASCDSPLLVAGNVLDSQQRPLGHATVELNGVKKETNENGCFYFADSPGGSELNLRVAKVGHKPYREEKELGSYNIIVILAPENDPQQSSATWQRSPSSEISKNKDCLE